MRNMGTFRINQKFFMQSHNFKMVENGAQEMEVFDTPDRSSGYVCMPVSRIQEITFF